ncbi:MAG: CtsR family transcriptional regulator [Hydrogenibacillus sp.]|nr:CtsR family transcriptional regulator [Hydrogenibacillus sp.]
MPSISDVIEAHLKAMLDKSGNIEIKRVQLAETFNCVPSQINYVIQTRFTVERGYLVESKRGGAGYIRIQKLFDGDADDLVRALYARIGEAIDEGRATAMIERLHEASRLTAREAALLRRMLSREVLLFPVGLRDPLRARLLKAAFEALLAEEGGGSDAL